MSTPEQKEHRRLYMKAWRDAHKEHTQVYMTEYNEKNKDRNKKVRSAYKKRVAGKYKQLHSDARKAVILHYSKGACCCANCGESFYGCLTLDHVNNDGAEHRKNRHGGRNMYDWAVKNRFPEGFQILCYNCNMMKAKYLDLYEQYGVLRRM